MNRTTGRSSIDVCCLLKLDLGSTRTDAGAVVFEAERVPEQQRNLGF